MKIADRRELCLLKNISAGGMLIRAYCPVVEGIEVSIELKQGESVTGIARWVRDGFVGVEFDEPIDVIDLLSLSAEGPRPRMPRVEVHCTGFVRDGAVTHRCKALNISQGGIKIESRAEMAVGTDVTVSLFGLQPCSGSIRWHEDNCYGITFSRIVPLQVLVDWLQDERARLRATG